jgi:hypothetical protein
MTDTQGTGPVAGRTSMLPCICLTDLETKEKNKFIKELRKDPFCACLVSCPFTIKTNYMNLYPSKSDSKDDAPLPLLRAVTTRGDRNLTEQRLGKNEVKRCYERVNARLPDHIKLDNVGMNVGRYTVLSICMNNNVDSITTSMATKHRCMESLKGNQ